MDKVPGFIEMYLETYPRVELHFEPDGTKQQSIITILPGHVVWREVAMETLLVRFPQHITINWVHW